MFVKNILEVLKKTYQTVFFQKRQQAIFNLIVATVVKRNIFLQ